MKRLLVYWLTVIMIICPLIACSPVSGDDSPPEGGDGANVSAASLAIGDYIQLGQYSDIPIVWRCIDIDENGILMLSNKTLCEKIFNVNTNFWSESVLRSWLNSGLPEGEGEWKLENDWGYKVDFDRRGSQFDKEKGFLHPDNFTHSERAVMKTVTQWTMLPEDHLDLAENGETKAYSPVKGMTPNKGITDRPSPICYDISELPDVFTGSAHQVE